MAIRQVPQAEIARRTGLHPRSVRRILDRTRAAIAINEDTEQARAEAVAVLREVQAEAWAAAQEARDRGRSPAMLLSEVRLAQREINALLGLAVSGPDDPALQLAQFKQVVVDMIGAEAPELAPRLARRLLAASRGEDR